MITINKINIKYITFVWPLLMLIYLIHWPLSKDNYVINKNKINNNNT